MTERRREEVMHELALRLKKDYGIDLEKLLAVIFEGQNEGFRIARDLVLESLRRGDREGFIQLYDIRLIGNNVKTEGTVTAVFKTVSQAEAMMRRLLEGSEARRRLRELGLLEE